jgi:hypothetical protein
MLRQEEAAGEVVKSWAAVTFQYLWEVRVGTDVPCPHLPSSLKFRKALMGSVELDGQQEGAMEAQER